MRPRIRSGILPAGRACGGACKRPSPRGVAWSLLSFESSSRRGRRGDYNTDCLCLVCCRTRVTRPQRADGAVPVRCCSASAKGSAAHANSAHLLGRSGRGRSDLVLQGTAGVVSSLLAAGSDDDVDEAAVVQHLLEGASARLLLLLGLLGLGGLWGGKLGRRGTSRQAGRA